MAKGFAKSTVTLAAGVAARLSDLLLAEGYTGSMVGKYLWIGDIVLGDLLRGADSALDASNGIPVLTTAPFIRNGKPGLAVDPAGVWLFSATGGDVSVAFDPF